MATEIAGLVDKLLEAESLIRAALAGVGGVEEAHIFGSWAARRTGLPVDDPADIDLLVVGDVDPDDVFDTLRDVEDTLGRPVNVVTRRPDEWATEESGFARSVRGNPRLAIISRHDG